MGHGKIQQGVSKKHRREIQIEKSTVEIYGGFLKWNSAPPPKKKKNWDDFGIPTFVLLF